MTAEERARKLISLLSGEPPTSPFYPSRWESQVTEAIHRAEADMQKRCVEAALSFIRKGGDLEQIAQAIKVLKSGGEG